jgi:hypothetical protein
MPTVEQYQQESRKFLYDRSSELKQSLSMFKLEEAIERSQTLPFSSDATNSYDLTKALYKFFE